MTSLATAKILLFIALSLGPQPDGSRLIFATSNSENYVWTHSGDSWALKAKGLPSTSWVDKGDQPPPNIENERMFRSVAHHRWEREPLLDLENGNQVMKQGKTVFYIIDPGAPNQKVFTIFNLAR